MSEHVNVRGPNSQNFFCQIRKIFVTLGLNILEFSRLKVFFKSKHRESLMLSTMTPKEKINY